MVRAERWKSGNNKVGGHMRTEWNYLKKKIFGTSLFLLFIIQFPNWFSDFDLIKSSLLSLFPHKPGQVKREITLVKSENQFSLGIYPLDVTDSIRVQREVPAQFQLQPGLNTGFKIIMSY